MNCYSNIQMLLMAFMGGIIGSITERILTAILKKAQKR